MSKDTSPTVLACSTDKYPECVDRIEIGASRDSAVSQVVMSLKPGGEAAYSSMPQLIGGDVISVSAELEVTTDHETDDRTYLVGQSYKFSPHVHASLLLASAIDVTDNDGLDGIRIGDSEDETVSQDRHHGLIVFEPRSFRIPDEGLPWNGESYLNLVLRAHHQGAGRGQLLLIGQNEPAEDGTPATAKGDEGKINLVRYRGQPEPTGSVIRAGRRRNSHVPISKKPPKPRVIYSMRLVRLKKHEQLLMKADFKTRDPHPYRARVSTEVIVADSADQTDRDNPAQAHVPFHGELGKGNGTNIVPGVDDTYRTRKYGTMRLLKDLEADLFVNVVVNSAPPASADPKPDDPRPQANDTVRILRGGYLEITRLPPDCIG
jgi:hypothetical protein